MHLLGIDENHEIFTTQTKLTRIRAVPRYSVTIETLEALNEVCPTIGIMPSGIPWLLKNSEGKGRSPAKSVRCKGQDKGMYYDPSSPPKLFDKDSYTLPYSEHACFSELEDFMQTVRPSTVVGIVRTSFCYVNPLHHFSHLCSDSSVNDDRTPMKNKGRDTYNLTPKRRQNGSVTPGERKVRIRISSSSLYRSKVTRKRKEGCGARIDDAEELIGVVA
jgi:DNA cross-link repair 1B protein